MLILIISTVAMAFSAAFVIYALMLWDSLNGPKEKSSEDFEDTIEQMMEESKISRRSYSKPALRQAGRVRERFCNLRTSQRVHRHLGEISDRMRLSVNDVINSCENRFVKLDSRLHELLHVVGDLEWDQQQKTEMITSHERKYAEIEDSLEKLLNSDSEVQFLDRFTKFSEQLSCYLAQVDTSIDTIRNSYPSGWLNSPWKA